MRSPLVHGSLVALVACACQPSPATPSPATAPPAAEPLVAMVVGTAHRGHLQIADYPLTKLDDLVAAFCTLIVMALLRAW